jgi:hypothetical protein
MSRIAISLCGEGRGHATRIATLTERLRDQQLPVTLIQASELRGRFLTYAASGEEAKRVSVDPIFGLENSFKAQYGQHQALLDPAFMATKREEEARLRAAVEADKSLGGAVQQAFIDRSGNIQAITVNEVAYVSVDFTAIVHA